MRMLNRSFWYFLFKILVAKACKSAGSLSTEISATSFSKRGTLSFSKEIAKGVRFYPSAWDKDAPLLSNKSASSS